MAKRVRGMLSDLTTTQLKNLLAARERIDVLDKEKIRLLKELAGVEKELKKILAGKVPAGRGRPKAAKKTVRRKVSAKKKTAGRKKVAKKAPVKKTGRKVAARKPAGSTRRPAGRGAKGGTLEDVILRLLGKKGKMAFKDLHATIVKEKLYKSKATKFDNVLRRTLSTSKKIKRVGRGVYAAA